MKRVRDEHDKEKVCSMGTDSEDQNEKEEDDFEVFDL